MCVVALSRVLVGLVVVATSRPSAAGVELRGDRAEPAWSRAVEELRHSLALRDDVDPDVVVEVTPCAHGAVVVARRPSGAIAERQVDDPEELAATILALVVVPAAPASPPPDSHLAPAIDTEAPPDPFAVDTIPASRAPVRGRFAFGAALGARWQGTLGMRVAGFADAAIGDWLVGANAGWTSGAGDQAVADDAGGMVRVAYTGHEVEAGIELGRRFRLGAGELSAVVGPRIAKSTRSFDTPMTTPATALGFDVRDVHDARLASSVRLKWGRASRIQMLVGFDASVDLAVTYGDAHAPIDGSTVQPMPMTAPRWAFALTVGGEVAP